MASNTHSSSKSSWDKAKIGGKRFFDKVGQGVNKVTEKAGAEAFWPTSLDKESEKAAKILRSFCIDGFRPSKDHTNLEHIAPEIFRNARGVAVFTVLRAGFHWSGAGGSGVVVSRLPNGQWSPPSGILIHTLGWGLMAGADIYDCVCVINDQKGMEGFTRVRCTLGGEVSASVGPLGAGGNVESQLTHPAPVWSYTKSKGLYVGVQIDGTVIAERTSENERFYGIEGVKNRQILAGDVQVPAGTMVQLWETLQACEGGQHDQNRLPMPGRAPSDYQLNQPREESQKEFDELGHHPAERMDSHEAGGRV